MALVECKECGHRVSSRARTCPDCGIDDPGISESGCLSTILQFVILVAIIWGISYGCETKNWGISNLDSIEKNRVDETLKDYLTPG